MKGLGLSSFHCPYFWHDPGHMAYDFSIFASVASQGHRMKRLCEAPGIRRAPTLPGAAERVPHWARTCAEGCPQALLWAETAGMASRLMQGREIGTAGRLGAGHPLLTSHLALESWLSTDLPPQLFLVLQINCFWLTCCRLPLPSPLPSLPVATPRPSSKQWALSVSTPPDVPGASTAVPLTPESKLALCRDCPCLLPSSMPSPCLPTRVLGLPFNWSCPSHLHSSAAFVDSCLQHHKRCLCIFTVRPAPCCPDSKGSSPSTRFPRLLSSPGVP